ncbi:MAG: NAD(P)H-dependent amine dehydrogenase family protein [Candidatus Bathycorpusculaceae bacterium]
MGMNEKIRVVLYGVGVVSSLIARHLMEKEGLQIVGAIDVAADKVGKDLGDVIGLDKRLGLEVSNEVDTVLSKTKPHVVIHATSSFFRDIYQQIASVVKHGVDVVSTCEELSFPYFTHPELAKELDSLAKKHNASVLGTGINPGFVMDTLIIALTGPCQKIEKITAARVMNAAARRVPFQKKIGVGLTTEEFRQKVRDREITGHVGLEQSIAMVASALGWNLDKIVNEGVEPVIAEQTVRSEAITVKAGNILGLRQKAKGLMKNKEIIILDFQAYIGAKEESDAITIEGVPMIDLKIKPCIHGDLGTVAMIVNAIPKVINGPPGLLTMKDLPVPSAGLGDIRKFIKKS